MFKEIVICLVGKFKEFLERKTRRDKIINYEYTAFICELREIDHFNWKADSFLYSPHTREIAQIWCKVIDFATETKSEGLLDYLVEHEDPHERGDIGPLSRGLSCYMLHFPNGHRP